MINKDRIVPVMATDLISLYAVILKQDSNNAPLAKATAKSAEGDFEITSAATPLLLNEPAKSIDLAAEVTSATLYFVPAYNFEGISLAGVKAEIADVDADGATLYSATLADSAVTVAKVGL